MLTRRGALGFTVLLLGCSSLTPPTNLAAVVSDGQLIDAAMLKMVPLVAAAYPVLFVNAQVAPDVALGWLDAAGGDLAKLAAQGSPASGLPTVQQDMVYFGDVMNIVVPITTAVNPTLGATIGGIAVLLAAMEAIVGAPAVPGVAARAPASLRATALAPGLGTAAARARVAAFLAAR